MSPDALRDVAKRVVASSMRSTTRPRTGVGWRSGRRSRARTGVCRCRARRPQRHPEPSLVRYDGRSCRTTSTGTGMRSATAESCVRFLLPRTGGQMEMTCAGRHRLTRRPRGPPGRGFVTNQRLRTALSLDGEWLPSVLRDGGRPAVGTVRRDRTGRRLVLVIAIDQEHAHGIAELLEHRFRVTRGACGGVGMTRRRPTSITRFAASAGQVRLVAVRMVSEGVDIPRVRVGVYPASRPPTCSSGRRWAASCAGCRACRDQRAWLYIPDDARLRVRAAQTDQAARRHSLRRERRAEQDETLARFDSGTIDQGAVQLSMFEALRRPPSRARRAGSRGGCCR